MTTIVTEYKGKTIFVDSDGKFTYGEKVGEKVEGGKDYPNTDWDFGIDNVFYKTTGTKYSAMAEVTSAIDHMAKMQLKNVNVIIRDSSYGWGKPEKYVDGKITSFNTDKRSYFTYRVQYNGRSWSEVSHMALFKPSEKNKALMKEIIATEEKVRELNDLINKNKQELETFTDEELTGLKPEA
jgi:hypothetical protein